MNKNYYLQRKAMGRREELKGQVLLFFPNCSDESGIYILAREERNEKGEVVANVGYVGQAVKVLTRIAEHLMGWQWIDVSLKKWGLFSENNQKGYKLWVIPCEKEKLNDLEIEYIDRLRNKGYELRNLTTGSQDERKEKMGEWKPSKTYQDGLKQGYENCRKYVCVFFEKYLKAVPKDDGKVTARKFVEFDDFLKGE